MTGRDIKWRAVGATVLILSGYGAARLHGAPLTVLLLPVALCGLRSAIHGERASATFPAFLQKIGTAERALADEPQTTRAAGRV